MHEFRDGEQVISNDASRGVIDKMRTTLAMFSPAGACTAFHMDWAEAKNALFPIEVKNALFPIE